MKNRTSTRRLITGLIVLILTLMTLPAFAEKGVSGKVNLNTASAEQLALLPRVGAAVAGRIIDFRKENGPFKVLEDLMLVRGIGEKTFDLLKPYIALEGETTLTEKVRVSHAAAKAKESDD